MDLNKVMLIGRVGRDPETKNVGGKSLVNFSLATGYGTGDAARTEWHQINAWEKLAEIAQQILHKGDRVYVEGRVGYNVVGEGDAKKTYTQITATNLINLTPRAEGSTGTRTATSNSTKPAATSAPAEDDIPF
jgi:single-strand DNA-binding protein